ncbi:hypothetical protein M0R45_016415 [Rubus argutus]|uniref:Uncharacterized protein n=1 Tax=Rubus argutus TaxID=59490 RepID=A0AAW1XTI2_RUBAR
MAIYGPFHARHSHNFKPFPHTSSMYPSPSEPPQSPTTAIPGSSTDVPDVPVVGVSSSGGGDGDGCDLAGHDGSGEARRRCSGSEMVWAALDWDLVEREGEDLGCGQMVEDYCGGYLVAWMNGCKVVRFLDGNLAIW